MIPNTYAYDAMRCDLPYDTASSAPWQVYPRMMKAFMQIQAYLVFSPLREKFTLKLVVVLCRAISPFQSS